jgi:hypothetical protein
MPLFPTDVAAAAVGAAPKVKAEANKNAEIAIVADLRTDWPAMLFATPAAGRGSEEIIDFLLGWPFPNECPTRVGLQATRHGKWGAGL